MYTNTNFKREQSRASLLKSRSTQNFYRKAAQRSLKHQISFQTDESECLACKHEKQTSSRLGPSRAMGLKTARSFRKNAREDYYKTNEDEQLSHVKKSKKYLQELLDKTRLDLKKSTELYEKRVRELQQEIKEKEGTINELRKVQNQREAEQYYQANASLVHTYQQNSRRQDEQEQIYSRKLKQLIRANQDYQEQLSQVYKIAADRQNKLEGLELEMVKLRENEGVVAEYEAMKVLISKMEADKISLLDRQHQHLQELEEKNSQEREQQVFRLEEMRDQLEIKNQQLRQNQQELRQLRTALSQNDQAEYQGLRELIEEREKECLQLQSRLNCIQSELTYVKGRYGYLLRTLGQGQMMESRLGDQSEVCLERIGRHQLSTRESLLGMNLSPIKHK